MTARDSQSRLNVSNHIINTVLDEPDDSPLYLALKERNYHTLSVLKLASMRPSVIEQLTYNDPDNNNIKTPLPEYLINTLLIFHDFILYLGTTGTVFTDKPDEWMALTKDEYDTYSISAYYPFQAPPTNSSRTAAVGASSLRQPPDELAEFLRGMKRDPTLYTTLKHAKDWDSYHRTLVAIAHTQNVYNVLDLTYHPTIAQQPLYKVKCQYMYAVFERTLLTDQGKALVRLYEDTSDARQIYSTMVNLMQKSTQAAIDSSKLISYITSVRYDDGSWRGTTHAFILHWLEQV